jgi:hypothetical protein
MCFCRKQKLIRWISCSAHICVIKEFGFTPHMAVLDMPPVVIPVLSLKFRVSISCSLRRMVCPKFWVDYNIIISHHRGADDVSG